MVFHRIFWSQSHQNRHWLDSTIGKKGETAVPVVFFAKDVVCFYFSGVWIVWVYTLSLEKKRHVSEKSEAHQASQSIRKHKTKHSESTKKVAVCSRILLAEKHQTRIGGPFSERFQKAFTWDMAMGIFSQELQCGAPKCDVNVGWNKPPELVRYLRTINHSEIGVIFTNWTLSFGGPTW